MIKATARALLPPIVLDGARRLRRALRHDPIPWEYLPGGWSDADRDPRIKGWNIDAIAQTNRRNWDRFVAVLDGSGPLAISPEHPARTDMDTGLADWLSIFQHNNIMSFAYALGRAARNQSRISMLDWGGGMGHYCRIAQALYPDLEIEYHDKDLPVAVEAGRALLPDAQFHVDEECLKRRYDLVLASGSFHYSQNWSETLAGLARATGSFLFVTQLPIVRGVGSYVVVQRPYSHGYDTEYVGWCLNRDEFLQAARTQKLRLVREFVYGFQPPIHHAPATAEYRGYLFEPVS